MFLKMLIGTGICFYDFLFIKKREVHALFTGYQYTYLCKRDRNKLMEQMVRKQLVGKCVGGSISRQKMAGGRSV